MLYFDIHRGGGGTREIPVFFCAKMANVKYTPTWKKYEQDANNPEDASRALEASDKFLAEREHEMKTNPQAKRWEESRKESVAKEKPNWVKARQKEERERIEKPLKSLKEIGSFDGNIKPQPGFLIVEIEKQEVKTDAGIYMPDEVVNKESNVGIVVEVSDPLTITHDNGVSTIQCPVSVGEKILFKRYAGALGSPGAELTIKGKDYRLMRWNPDPKESDILGIFYD